MYVRDVSGTDDFVRTKFLGCIDNQSLVSMVLRSARERAPLSKKHHFKACRDQKN